MRTKKEIINMLARLEDSLEETKSRRDIHIAIAYFMANAWKECLEWVLQEDEVIPDEPIEEVNPMFVQKKKRGKK